MAFDTQAKIIITGEAQGLEAAMNRAHQVVSQRSRDIEGVLRSATGMLSALGVGLSTTAIVAFAANAVKSAAALDDMAEATGASVRGLSKLTDIARIGGQDINQVQTALVRLNKALSGTDDESKGAGAAFKALGLSMQDLQRLAPDQQLERIAKAFAGFADGAGKTSAAIAIFGRSGAELLPLLKDIAEQSGRLASLTDEQAAAAERLEKQWNALSVSASNWARSMVMDLIPALNTFFELANKQDVGFGGAIDATIGYALRKKLGVGDKNIQTEIREQSDKLGKMVEDREKSLLPSILGPSETDIQNLRAYIAGLKEIASIEALAGAGASYGNEGRLAQLPYIPSSGTGGSGGRAAKTAEYWGIDVFRDAARDTEKLFSERAEMLDKYGLAGSKKYMEHLKEEYEFERWAQRELYDDARTAQQQKLVAEKRAAEDAQREWERTSQGITDSLTDALLRGFEGGADAAKNFVETLKNMFATLVLRPIIQPIAQSAAGLVLGGLGMGSANASGGGLGLGDAFGIGSAINGITGGAGFGGAVASGLEALGASSGVATGWGAFAGAAMPYVAIAALAYSMLKPKRGGPKSRVDLSAPWQNQYEALVEQLGGIPGSFSPYLQYEADPMGTATTSIYSGVLNYQRIGRDVGRDEAALQAGLAEESARMMIAALRATDLPAAARDIFAAIDPATASAAQLADALARAGKAARDAAKATEDAAKAAKEAAEAERERTAAYLQWVGLARGVVQTRIDLAGGDLSVLSPEARLAASRGSFSEIARRAALGEQAAFGDLSGAASGYLSAARGYYASGSGYTSIYSEVHSMLEAAQNTALRQAALTGGGSVADLVSETAAGNRANEAGLSAMLAQLQAINARLASIEATNALAAAA